MADLGPLPDNTNYLSLAAPLRDRKVAGFNVPDPNATQPTPGFSQWLANLAPSRDGVVNFASDVLGTPVDGPAMVMREMGAPISWKMAHDPITGQQAKYNGPDVPFSSLWWRNAINNPTLTWDQVRAALQSPSMRFGRGLGSLF